MERTLEKVSLTPGINVVIINNGSDREFDASAFANRFASLKEIVSDTNKGSAWAFAAGMQYVYDRAPEAMILLLDDDNLLEEGAITTFQNHFDALADRYGEDALMIMGWRVARHYLSGVLSGYPVQRYQYTKNEFLGFSFSRVMRKLTGGYKNSGSVDSACLQYAPYGGLFFSAGYIKRFGLPNTDYFVYADDFEFSSRCTRAGGAIVLVRDVIIADQEESWQNNNKTLGMNSNILYGSAFRVYYSVRNFLIFQQSAWVTTRWIFRIHGMVYSILLLLLAVYHRRWVNYRIYRAAVRDGLKRNFIVTDSDILNFIRE